jgi:hypothetical protein
VEVCLRQPGRLPSSTLLQGAVLLRDVLIETTTDMISGYGYEYLSPSNFQLPEAVVTNNVLAPNGPAYKALILRQTDLLTTDGVAKLAQYAKQGLPIIMSGGIPTRIASSTGLAAAQATPRAMTSLPNVHTVAAGPLASTVASIGIQPLTKVSADQPWYTY